MPPPLGDQSNKPARHIKQLSSKTSQPAPANLPEFEASVSVLMAPAISFGAAPPSSPAVGKKGSGAVEAEAEAEAELLRRRNAELEREVAALRLELGAARRRAEAAEDAEERLCAQLGDAEVEAVEIARAYQDQVEHLARELAAARAAAGSSSQQPPRGGSISFVASRDATGFSRMMEYVL